MSLGISSDLNTNFKQCSRCVMDTSDTEIVFDDEIFCNHCNSHLLQMKKIENGKDAVNAQLKRKILEIKESYKDYPNNKRITSIIYKIYLFLTNKPEVV